MVDRGQTRNYGIEKTIELVGKERFHNVYISFVDSDDWLELKVFELLYNESAKNNADIVCADHRFVLMNDEIIYKGFWGTNIDDPFQRIFYANVHTVWNKIYRLSLFDNLRYPSLVHDDTVTIPLVFRQAKTVSYIPEILYNYLKRYDSVTGSGNIFLKPDALRVVNLLLDYASIHNELIEEF